MLSQIESQIHPSILLNYPCSCAMKISLIKPVILAMMLTSFSSVSFGQAYMDELGKKACECFEKHDPDKLNGDELTTQIGICMLVEAQAYKK